MSSAVGFDGVEVPIFDASDPEHYARLGVLLDDLGLRRTVTTTIPDPAHDPCSESAAARQAGYDHLARVVDCCAALGAEVLMLMRYREALPDGSVTLTIRCDAAVQAGA